jgi:ATP-dependent Clp protease ATP-binding subunit ClpC
MQLRSESSKSFIGDKGKFMAHHLNRMEHGGRPEALSDHYGLVEDTSAPVDTDVQKLLSNESNKPIRFSAIVVAVALLSLAAMVGVRMRRRMQPAIALAGSSGYEIDMSIPLAKVSADNTLHLESHCPRVRIPDQFLKSSEKNLGKDMHAVINSSFVLWDPLDFGEGAPKAHVNNFRESELQHGRVATFAVFFVSAAAAENTNVGGQRRAVRRMLFDKFDAEAVNVLMYAQQETRSAKLGEVGTEQVLLGVLQCPENAKKALEKFGVTLQATRDIVGGEKQSLGDKAANLLQGPLRREEEPLPFTARSKACFKRAVSESEAMACEEVRPEHLLLAIARDEASEARSALEQLGIDADALADAVAKDARKAKGSLVGIGADGEERETTLASVGVDLTAMAFDGELDPCVGRKDEIARAVQILLRRRKSNPCLVGDAGVGKTAIAEGLAQRIADGEVPKKLIGCRVHTLEMALLVAGTKYRGEFEERLRDVVAEASADTNTILFIDELHTLVGAGAADGAIDAGNILKPALARGGLRCIGATTIDEYRKHVEKDPALERRFQPITVDEPSVEETVEILEGLRADYEEHHEVTYSDEAVASAAAYGDRYLNDRFLPDKAIDLLDEAGAAAQVRAEANNGETLVSEDDVAAVVSTWTGIPVQRMTRPEQLRLMDLETELHEDLIGQDSAVTSVARAIRRARVGMRSPQKPVASFIFAGPTGVGKTFVAKTLAKTYYGDEKTMVRFDMSEYMERHTVSRLVGSPPGYVGFDDGGQLTNAVRRTPHCVLLFDEIEKAHGDVYNLMLQILDDGRLTDAKGRTVDFSNTVVVFTSNVGSQDILAEFDAGGSADAIRGKVTGALSENFRPEFLNRLDEIVVFDPLDRAQLGDVLETMLREVYTRAEVEEMRLAISDALKDEIVAAGAADARFGARPLRRAVQRFVEDVIAEGVLGGGVDKAKPIVLDYSAGQVLVMQNGHQVCEVSVDAASFGGVEAAKDAELRSAMPNLPFDIVDDETPLEAAVPAGGGGGGKSRRTN